MRDICHIVRSAYPGITEQEILWEHDWHWIHETVEMIQFDQREQRRWGLATQQALAASIARVVAGMFAEQSGDQVDPFTSLWDMLEKGAPGNSEEAQADAARRAWEAKQAAIMQKLKEQNDANIRRWQAIEQAEREAAGIKPSPRKAIPSAPGGPIIEMETR